MISLTVHALLSLCFFLRVPHVLDAQPQNSTERSSWPLMPTQLRRLRPQLR